MECLDSYIASSTDVAWAAGIIDGEGFIGFGRSGNYFSPILSVNNTNKPLLFRLKQIFGGMGNTGSYKQYGRNKQAHWWRTTNTHAINVIKQLYPYLLVKKQQAKYMLEFDNRRIKWSLGKFIPKAELQQREFFQNLIKALNKRGV